MMFTLFKKNKKRDAKLGGGDTSLNSSSDTSVKKDDSDMKTHEEVSHDGGIDGGSGDGGGGD